MVKMEVRGRYSAITRAAPLAAASSVSAEHPGDRLRVISDLDGKQRLVMPVGAGIALARHVVGSQAR